MAAAKFAEAWQVARMNWRALTAIVAMFLATSVLLRLEGRRWWCACGQMTAWSSDAWGSHNSQHFLDPYALTHVEHGILLYGLLILVCPRLASSWRFCLAMLIECGWEVLENSPPVIDRYRNATAALGYTGDTIANALGDIVACLAGYWLAKWLGLWRSVTVLIFFELLLLVWIRDNLALNVLMLVWPSEAILNWQAAPGR